MLVLNHVFQKIAGEKRIGLLVLNKVTIHHKNTTCSRFV